MPHPLIRDQQDGACLPRSEVQRFRLSRRPLPDPIPIVFAALAIARHLQNTAGESIRKIVQTLRPIQQITVRIAGHEQAAAGPITPDAEAILTALQINPH